MLRPISLLSAFLFMYAWSGHDDQTLIQKAQSFMSQTKLTQVNDHNASVQRSKFGYHIRFQQKHQGLPLFNSSRVVHLDKNLKLLKKRETPTIERTQSPSLPPHDVQKLALTWLHKQHQIKGRLAQSENGYLQRGNLALPITRLIFKGVTPSGMPQSWLVDLNRHNGHVETFTPLHLHAEADALIYANNPIAATGLSPKSNTDWSSALVDVTLRGLDGSGILRGEFVDLTAPGFGPPLSHRPGSTYTPGSARPTNGRYDFDPGDPAFEEVMIYYYIDNTQRYLHSLGFDIYNRPIPVHAHYFVGNNAFYSFQNRGLHFGDGIVDSGEDASVITHEYGHAILGEITYDKFWDLAGLAFHEGFADYFSFATLRALAPEIGVDRYPYHLGEWFFKNADHDPPHLRTLLPPPFTYPNVTRIPHTDGGLWSSAFRELDEKGEPGEFLSLLLEALHITESARPHHMIPALYQTDQDFYDGTYTQHITDIMTARGLLLPEDNAIELSLDERILVPINEDLQLYKFTLSEDDQDVALQFEPLTQAFYSVYFATEGIPSLLNNDVELISQSEPHTWNFSQKPHSNPRLEAGKTYYFAIRNDLNMEINFTRIEDNATDPVDMSGGQQVDVGDLNYRTSLEAFITAEAATTHLNYEITSQNQGSFLLYLNEHTLSDDISNPETTRISMATGSGLLEIPENLRGKTIYIVFRSSFTSHTNVSLQLTQRAFSIREAEVNTHLEGTLGESGVDYWRFNPGTSDQLYVTASSEVSLQAHYNGSSTLSASQFNGAQTLILRNDQATFNADRTIIPSIESLEDVLIIIEGTPGQAYQLSSNTQEPGGTQTFESGATLSGSLEAGQLTRYLLQTPEDAYALSLNFAAGTTSESLWYQIFEQTSRNPLLYYSNGRPIDHTGAFMRQLSNAYQVSAFAREDFLSGATYELWLYNPSQTTQSFSGLYSIQTTDSIYTDLNDGDTLELDPSQTTDRYGSFDAHAHWFRITPPAGTQSVHIDTSILTEPSAHFAIPNGRDGLNFYEAKSLVITEAELGYCPDQGFPIALSTYFPGQRAPRFSANVHLTYSEQREFTFEQSGNETVELIYENPYHATVQPDSAFRKLEFGVMKHSEDDDPATSLYMTQDPDRLNHYNEELEPIFAFNLFQYESVSPHLPLSSDPYYLTATSTSRKYQVRDFNFAGPFQGSFHVRVHDLKTDTTVPAVHGDMLGANLEQRLITVINPSDEAVTLTHGDTQTEIPAHGATQLRPENMVSLKLSAEKSLVLFEELLGSNWSSLNAPSPNKHNDVFLPHMPPNTSAWTVLVVTDNEGQTGGSLYTIRDGIDQSVPAEITSSHRLTGQIDTPTHLNLRAGFESDTPFRESQLTATQYWTLDNYFASNSTDTKPTSTIVIPHIPNFEQWWMGLSITNPNLIRATIRIHGYDAQGNLLPETRSFRLNSTTTKIGVLQDFFESAGTAAWLRVESDLPILGTCFIGAHADGYDAAAYVLPSEAYEQVVLPGTGSNGWYGLAVVNPQSYAQTLRVDAVGLDGNVLATHTAEMDGNARTLIVGETTFPDLTDVHYLRATGSDGRIIAMQLSGHGQAALSLQSGIGVK